jgi:hypothetical protein
VLSHEAEYDRPKARIVDPRVNEPHRLPGCVALQLAEANREFAGAAKNVAHVRHLDRPRRLTPKFSAPTSRASPVIMP